MLWLVFSIVLGLVAVGGVVFGVGVTKVAVPVASVVVWGLLTVGLSLHTVGQRQVGIVQSFSGTIGNSYKNPGVVMTAPWNHIQTENVGLQKEIFDFNGENTAVSRDQQPINAEIAVNYQVEPKDAVALWKTVGPNWKTVLLDGRIPQAFKETTAQFRSANITLERPKLREITLQRLRSELSPYGIRVVDVFISNIGYSATYTNAIEAKLRQQQAALTAEAKVAQAKAEADQAIAKAKGEARSIQLEGEALRNNPQVLTLTAIQKLNPNAQVVFCNNGSCPSFLPSSFANSGGK